MKIMMVAGSETHITYDYIFNIIGSLIKQVDILGECLDMTGYMTQDRWNNFQIFHQELRNALAEVKEDECN